MDTGRLNLQISKQPRRKYCFAVPIFVTAVIAWLHVHSVSAYRAVLAPRYQAVALASPDMMSASGSILAILLQESSLSVFPTV